MHRSKSRRQSSHSMVETLEDRRLFAVGIAVAGNSIAFTGNAANDTLIVNDDGLPGGTISGFRTIGAGVLVPFGPFPNINIVNMNMGAGSDTVRYSLNGDMLAGGVRYINANMEDGSDSFSFSATNDIDLGPNAYVNLTARGGLGKDKLSVFHKGELDGLLVANLFGDDGEDTLITDVLFDNGSAGTFNTNSRGGWGNDAIDVLVRKVNVFDPTAISAWARGEGNVDTIRRTVWAANDATCEIVAVVP